MADGLRQMNAELMLTKGIEQKVPDVVIPDESLARAENVDFSKVGIAKKRQGFVRNSNLVLNAGVLDEVRRLGVRQRREVLCITETVTQIGSAAGVGNAGDTLFSYSEQAERWIVRGKMPRPNVDVLWTSSTPGDANIVCDFVCGGIGNYVCIAHQTNTPNDTQSPIMLRVVIFDVGGDVSGAVREAPTVIIDTVFAQGVALLGWFTAGDNVWLIYSTSDIHGNYSAARAFRRGAVTFDSVETPIFSLLTDSVGVAAGAASSDGTNIYVTFILTPGGYVVRKFDENLARIAEVTNTTLLLPAQEQSVDARLGHVDIVRRDIDTGAVYVSRYEKSTLAQDLANSPITSGSVGGRGNLTICTISDTDAVILWGNANTTSITTRPAFLTIVRVRMSTGAAQGLLNHMGIVPYAQPFIVDGRVFFVAFHSSGYVHPNANPNDLTGTRPGEESFMCFQIPIDNLNAYSVPFPAAQWDYGQCVVKAAPFGAAGGTFWVNGKTVYQSGSGVYVLTSGAFGAGQTALDWLSLPRLTRLEFGDATHRWRHEEFHDLAAFAGGIPFVYDGTRAYEMATALHQPIPLAWNTIVGGSLADGVEIQLQSAMLYVDGNGRECWSQPSRKVSVIPTLAGGLQAIHVVVMPVTTTMKPGMGNGFTGRMKLYLFAATRNAPDEFKVAAIPVDVNPYSTFPITFSISDPWSELNDLMYTSGFELDNFPAPPCRAMAIHEGRAFVIASDSNEVFYTKPFRSDRGPEFALGQSLTLPDKGTALASINSRLVVFTHRSVLAVQGDGPDVTGAPPDAFSRPVLVSQDYGCIEYCAVGRTPLGVIFRGQQGFYLLSMGFDVVYIGAQVEDITSQWLSTRSIVHDQKSACCRITGFTGDRSEELCYWYDTKRWSLNVLASSIDGIASDAVDSIALGDNLLVAVTDTTVAVASRYRLGSRAVSPSSRDFDNSYQQTLETGWLSFQNAGVFKRIWRVYAQVRAFDTDATVRFQIWKDWEDRVSSDREFELTSLDTEARLLRVHLKHQKLKAIKVRVTVTSEGKGADVLKLGFELGIRKSGPKEVRENTQ